MVLVFFINVLAITILLEGDSVRLPKVFVLLAARYQFFYYHWSGTKIVCFVLLYSYFAYDRVDHRDFS